MILRELVVEHQAAEIAAFVDAYVRADAIRNDRHRFRQVEVDHPLVVQIRELPRVHEHLQGEMNRLTNRLRDQIRRPAPRLPLRAVAGRAGLW